MILDALSKKFEDGLIGSNTFEIKQQIEAVRIIKELCNEGV